MLICHYVAQRELVSLDLVIVDFASSVSVDVVGRSMIGTNAYRAPEVTLGGHVRVYSSRALIALLGMPWNKQVDVFSCGCVLVELCTGGPLFGPSSSVAERMKALERVIEPFSVDMAHDARTRFPSLFEVDGTSVRVVAPREHGTTRERVRRTARLPTLSVSTCIACLRDRSKLTWNTVGPGCRQELLASVSVDAKASTAEPSDFGEDAGGCVSTG